ncbi:MAG: dihydrofolate reductase, partial [Gammaproteobacteria bacterium]|nr:dihydrofolate reductase [Gammaproteobacteria bacterium]
NIIVTRQPDFSVAGCDRASSLEDAILLARPEINEVMIIGGAQLFEQALSISNTLYLTLLDIEVLGDTYFPEWQQYKWYEKETINFFDEKAQISGKFITLMRDEKRDVA